MPPFFFMGQGPESIEPQRTPGGHRENHREEVRVPGVYLSCSPDSSNRRPTFLC